MKRSKILLLALLLILFVFPTNAQTVTIRGGLNFSNLLEKGNDSTYSNLYKSVPGFHFGATCEIPFGDLLSLEAGLFFTTKGTKYDQTLSGNQDLSGRIIMYYLDLPVSLKVSHTFKDMITIFGEAGPYIDMGLIGKRKSTLSTPTNEYTIEDKIKWGNSTGNYVMRRFDTGLSVGGGVKTGPFLAAVTYNLGLSNIAPTSANGTKIKNRVFQISFGFSFGK